MIDTKSFYDLLIKHDMDFFAGVPDSLLANLCACIKENAPQKNNIITANEGNAIAMCAGYHMATNKCGVVYMQNSGQGNAVNPLLSLADEEVYSIPMLLLIGWRGEPGKHDEPQHIKQGKLTIPLLETMEIKYDILKDTNQITSAFEYMKQTNKPFAFIVKKGIFAPYKKEKIIYKYDFTREKAIQIIISLINDEDIVVSTTGMISRELYENRGTHEKDFLTVGSMGHASSIALGIAINKPNRKVICFDGDGAFLMHMGAIPVIASLKQDNIKHIIFNNEAHDSVGAQPTVSENIDIKQIAISSGYNKAFSVSNEQDIKDIWKYFYSENGTNLLEIKVNCGARDNLSRPKESPKDNRDLFMKFIRG